MTDITQAQKTALLKLPGFKAIQKQYAVETKQAGSGKRRMKMRGGGFWDDVGNWFNQAGKDINQFLKDSKIVSNISAYALPILGAMGGALLTANPLGATAGGIAGKSTADYIRSQGYGYVNTISTLGTKKKKMKGGRSMKEDAQLIAKGIVGRPAMKRVMGMGAIYSQNGMLVKQPKQSGGGMRGDVMGGATTQYNVVSTQPSKVAF
jgi:hypothetical protein